MATSSIAYDYLDGAVDHIMWAQLNLEDTDGNKIASTAQKRLFPLPATYPFFVNYIGGGAFTKGDQGAPWHERTYRITMRYILGKQGEKFTGNIEQLMWTHIPLIADYFDEYPYLNYDASLPFIEELSPKGAVITGLTRVGVFRDLPTHVGMEYTLDVPFIVQIVKNYANTGG